MNELLNRVLPLLVACAAVLLTGATFTPQMLGDEARRSLADGRLAVLLSSPNTQTAARAALAIGRTKKPDGARLLELHTNDPRIAVRALSVYGLGLIGLRADAPLLIRAASDRSDAVRLAALDAIGRFEDAKLLETADQAEVQARIQAILVQDASTAVRGRAALTLAAFADGPRAGLAARVLELATSRSQPASVRQRAMWAIFRRYAARVPRPFLRAVLGDRDEIVRLEAVRAYGRLKDPALVADLRPLLADPSWRVQEQAAESIRLLRGEEPTQHLSETPSGVHVPSPVSDPLANLPALSRAVVHRGAPRPADVPAAPALDPQTAAQMLEPAHGPHPRLRFRTSEGNYYAVLYPEWAPLTVANFLNLVNRGFFDNNRWFRVVPDFVVQTGEQDDIKQPGPGYTIPAEENPLEQNSFILSMGLDYDMKTMTPKRDSAGSEYYITLSPQYHLDEPFTVFGVVTSGFDVFGRLTEHDRVIRIERIADVVL
jgi:peptidyl-prolyl cis-trans isomerase B (cyclophilin B)